MKISRKHPITGKHNILDLNITDEQIMDYQTGTSVQKAFPNLTADEREFIISGMLPGEYDEMFPEEPEDK